MYIVGVYRYVPHVHVIRLCTCMIMYIPFALWERVLKIVKLITNGPNKVNNQWTITHPTPELPWLENMVMKMNDNTAHYIAKVVVEEEKKGKKPRPNKLYP